MHRLIEVEIKTCTLRQNTSGEGLVPLSAEVEMHPLSCRQEAIGMDVGLKSFPILSNGEEIVNPRFNHPEELRLAKEQKKLSKLPKGTKERRKVGKVVSKIGKQLSPEDESF
ncbi:MAG: transposase [Chlamydiae bacterium]|nr:transposase [Chlamydiota bacterium]